MEILIVFVLLGLLCVLSFVFNFRIEDMKKYGENEKLNKLAEKLPDNLTICKDILKILENSSTKVKENSIENSGTSLYVSSKDTITISKGVTSFARVQTIAHECIHSIQEKKLHTFNSIFANVNIIYYFGILIASFFVKFPLMFQVTMLTWLRSGFVTCKNNTRS